MAFIFGSISDLNPPLVALCCDLNHRAMHKRMMFPVDGIFRSFVDTKTSLAVPFLQFKLGCIHTFKKKLCQIAKSVQLKKDY